MRVFKPLITYAIFINSMSFVPSSWHLLSRHTKRKMWNTRSTLVKDASPSPSEAYPLISWQIPKLPLKVINPHPHPSPSPSVC